MRALCSSERSRHGTSRSMPYFSASAESTLPWYSVWELAHGTTAPSLTLRSAFGTTRSGSISSRLPSPSQRSQAPCGLLNEKVLGCISAMEAPQLVQVKVSEKSMDSPEPIPSTVSICTSPSDSFRAVSTESVRRRSMPSRITSRSTTTSMSCLRSEEHTSELQSRQYLVCRLLLEKKKHADLLLIRSFLSGRLHLSTCVML